MSKPESLVSCEQLKQVIDSKNPNVKVLDASWFMPASGRNPHNEFNEKRIPTSIFFDVDKQFASNDPALAHLPHMIPTIERFEEQASLLGLNNTDEIYLYDRSGIFSVCRAWFLFHIFGHDTVKVVEGGFPKWEALKYPIETGSFQQQSIKASQYKVKQFRKDRIRYLSDVLKNLETKQEVILDARPRERWAGLKAEPRPGVRAGRIPGAKSVPFDSFITADKTFKTADEIKQVLNDSGYNTNSQQTAVMSCGSGLSACILYFGMNQLLHMQNIAVYDGSASEYNQEKLNNPMEKDA